MDSLLHLFRSLPIHIIDRITGKLLGDGNISIEKNKKPRLRFSHCLSDKEWALHCYKELKDYVPFSTPKERKIFDERIIAGFTESIYVQSLTFSAINVLKNIWYEDRRKVIPFELLEEGISPVTLAWWYQDDGHLKCTNGVLKKVILSTDSFSKEENKHLTKLLDRFYHFNFRLDGQNRIILYEKAQILYFLDIIKPYLHSSMRRKYAIPVQPLSYGKPKRTTVYLPKFIKFVSPTKDIRDILLNLNKLQFLLNKPTKYQEIMFRWYESIKLATHKGEGFQVVIELNQLEIVHSIQQKTGLTLSQIVYLCYKIKQHDLLEKEDCR